MADSFSEDAVADPTANPVGDVEMGEGAEEASTAGANTSANGVDPSVAEDESEVALIPRTTFAQYLTSPVVTLIVGGGDGEAILTAHQSLLTRSPFFAEACAEFADDGSVGRPSLLLPARREPKLM